MYVNINGRLSIVAPEAIGDAMCLMIASRPKDRAAILERTKAPMRDLL